MNPSILPVMGYTLESHSKSPIELRQAANYVIKPFLSQVKGVSEVRIIGGRTKEYWVVLDLQKMSALSVTPDMINAAMSQTGFIKSNGYLSDYRHLYLTVTDATVRSTEDIGHIVLSNNGKRIIQLLDVADVSIQERIEYTRINANGSDAVLIAVIKQPGANLLEMSSGIESRLKELEKILPKDMTVRPYYLQADFVNGAIKSVSDSLWTGFLLAILVAILFLRSLKASATILFTIPVTMGLTLIVLYAAGYTMNIMTLGALVAAIGLIIDDAIVVVEQIHRTHEEFPDEPSSLLVKKAIAYLFPAMVGSSISTIVIFVPFFLMTGVAGSYFKVLTDTMIITLVCSFFVTWICLPVIYLNLSPKRRKLHSVKEVAKDPVIRSRKWVSFFIHRPIISILLVIALGASVYLILPRLETGFLPEMDEGSIVLDYNSPPGTSLEETDRMLREVEKIITATPEVTAYSRRTGTEMGFFITEPNRGDYLIQLKNKREKTTEEVIETIRKKVEATQPALRIDFGQVITDMLGDLMTSVQPIEIKVFGDDQHKLQELSRQMSGIVSAVKGTADVFDGIVIAGPSVSIEPNYGRLAQFGITPAGLQYQLQTSLEGNVVGELPEKEQFSNIRIVYPGSRSRSIADIGNLRISLPGGGLKPISEMATVKLAPGDVEIKRENLQSMGVVSARLEGRDLGSVISEIRRKIAAELVLPQGYHVEYGGAYAEQQQSFGELLIILVTASLLVFGVILFLFREFKAALLILAMSVLGISGSYLALYLTHTPLNVGSYTGLIMIVGIIGENAIFTFLQFQETLQTRSVEESIIYAISTRLRPKLMTALGAIMALLPLALGIGTGALLHQPLAIAVIGGFVVALPLLLIVFPSLLALVYREAASKA
jgi:CzcA family heavy metal efflux pump